MQLEIGTFKYKDKPVEYIVSYLHTQLKESLSKLNIGFNSTYVAGRIIFKPVKDNKLFVSTVKNKIMLKASDPRVEKTGRDYLFSERLTQEQYDGMINVLNSFFDKTGIECDIKFYEFKDDDKSFSLWRQGKVKHTVYKPNSFPVKV